MKKYTVAIYINGILYKSNIYNWNKKQLKTFVQLAQWGEIHYEFKTLYKNQKRIFVYYNFTEALYMDSAIRHIDKKQYQFVSQEYLEGYCTLWANILKTITEECIPKECISEETEE